MLLYFEDKARFFEFLGQRRWPKETYYRGTRDPLWPTNGVWSPSGPMRKMGQLKASVSSSAILQLQLKAEEDTCMSYEEEDTCMLYERARGGGACAPLPPEKDVKGGGGTTSMSCEEEDTCMSYEEEDTCMSYVEEERIMADTRKRAGSGRKQLWFRV